MRTRLQALALVLAVAAPAQAADRNEASGKDRAARLFGPDRVWTFHLTIPSKNWDAMHPTRGLPFFGAPALAPAKGKEKDRPEAPPRGGFGFDFPYVKGELAFDGK